MVRSAHGLLPNPAPAVVELLEGIPTEGRDLSVELTTPTGAAMLAAWGSSFGPMPAMTIEATGFGAGARELEDLPELHPGRHRAAGGVDPGSSFGEGQQLVQIEANLDDVTGETLAHAVAALLDEGALDAWVTPVLMKKGRPGPRRERPVRSRPRRRACASAWSARRAVSGCGRTASQRWAAPRQTPRGRGRRLSACG